MIFVDTGAWIAFSDRHDCYHQESARIYTRLKQRKEQFLTTDYVLDETITRLRYDLNHAIAVKFLDFIEKAQEANALRVVFVDNDIFRMAENIFRRYDAVTFSFTDCTSFAICKKFHIAQAFSFDQHFTMMGIVLGKGEI